MASTIDEAFPGYVVESNETGPAFITFVLVYTSFAFFLIFPLVSWGRYYEKNRQASLQFEQVAAVDAENPCHIPSSNHSKAPRSVAGSEARSSKPPSGTKTTDKKKPKADAEKPSAPGPVVDPPRTISTESNSVSGGSVAGSEARSSKPPKGTTTTTGKNKPKADAEVPSAPGPGVDPPRTISTKSNSVSGSVAGSEARSSKPPKGTTKAANKKPKADAEANSVTDGSVAGSEARSSKPPKGTTTTTTTGKNKPKADAEANSVSGGSVAGSEARSSKPPKGTTKAAKKKPKADTEANSVSGGSIAGSEIRSSKPPKGTTKAAKKKPKADADADAEKPSAPGPVVDPPRTIPTESNSVSGGSGLGIVLREFDRVAEAEYPDLDPEFASLVSGRRPGRGGAVIPTTKTPTDIASAIPSAATTSRLHAGNRGSASGKRPPTRIWDVGGRRWKHRRPIGRFDVIHNAIQNESGSMRFDGQVFKKDAATSSRVGEASKKGMSDIATSVLEEQIRMDDTMFLNQAAILNMQSRQRFLRRNSRGGSFSAASAPSIMSSIVDDITPNDAADAGDPGRGNVFHAPDPVVVNKKPIKMGCFSSLVENVVELVEPDAEMKRVLRLAFPLTLGAISEPLLRTATVALIAHYVGSESMIAYVLVVLFVRLTSEELSGAIIDALSSFLQTAFYSGEGDTAFLAGQYVQLAVLLQLILGIPLLVVWALVMGDAVEWLVQSSEIATIAEGYTRVVVFNYLAHAVSRTYTVVFHICGHEHFESCIDFGASALTMVAVACVVGLVGEVDLNAVAYVQLMIGVTASLAKIAYPVLRGWMKPFRKGMLENFALSQNPTAFWNLGLATIPLFVGTVLEYGEWELLTIFLRYLGPAEVATWALLSCVWEILEASTEGIGEAAATRVAYLLAVAQPELARKLSHKVMYFSFVQAVFVTSIIYMLGKYLAMLLSTDPTLQHLMYDVIPLIGLANITMSFAQAGWSLTGAQGRYRLATLIIFVSRWLVTMPMALVSIFGFSLDLNSVSGSLVVGYATASCTLAYVVLRSDWERLTRIMQDMNNPLDDSNFLENFDDEDDSGDDESAEEAAPQRGRQ